MKKMLYAASFVAVTGFAFADPTGTGGKTAVESDAEQIVYGDENAVNGAIDGESNQHSGFYIGAGCGMHHSGFDFRSPATTSEKDLPANVAPAAITQIYVMNTAGAPLLGGNPITAADLTALQTAIGGAGARLVQVNGAAPANTDFMQNVGAGLAAGQFGLVDITNNAYRIVYDEREVTVDQKKDKFSGTAVLGYGKAFAGRYYLGLEFMYDVSEDNKSNKDGLNIKTKGCVPITALRLGVLYNGWLVYAKVGMAQQDASVDNQDFNHTALVLGGGVEKSFCKRFTLRLDADWHKGKDKKLHGFASRHIDAGVAGAPPPAPGVGRYGYANAEDLAYNREVNFKKKDVWNIRLLGVCHIKI